MSENSNNPYPWTNPASGASLQVPMHPSEAQKAYLDSNMPMADATPMTPTRPVNTGPVFGGVVMRPGQTLLGALGEDFFPNLILVGAFGIVWICLYPVAALGAFLTFAVVWPLLGTALGELGAAVTAGVATLVVLWTLSRFEHVWARSRLYRIPRHFVRLPLLGLATIALIEEWHGLPYTMTPQAIRFVLSAPLNIGLVAAVMIASHFILWNWNWGRAFWHRRLTAALLRKSGP